MKRFVCSAVVVCALSLSLAVPALAQAQDVIPMGFTADGSAVVYISDPLSGGDAFEWSKAGDGVAESFYAVCAPAPFGTAAWNQGCTVCIRDASVETARPADCGLTDEKWPSKIKAANKSPSKKIAVKTKRTCTGKGDAKACKTAVTVGKVGSVTIDEASPKHKAVVSAYFRKDSGAVLIISDEESASDESIHMHSLLVMDLAPPSEAVTTSAYVKKWEKLADKVCACKNLKCLEKLQAQLSEMAATAEQDTTGISPEDAEQLAKEVERMTTCATAIIEKGK